ncbi:MAG TPA: ketopantoate reductase family protein [Polyangiales bacterium]
MRFLVVGAGGVGGYLGARLIAAGQDVQIVARGPHAAALAQHGLLIHGPKGEERVPVGTPVEAKALRGTFDVVLLAVKWPGLSDACDELARVLAPDGVVLPLLNGLSSEDVVASYVGAQRTLAAVAYMSAGLTGPGEIYAHGNTRIGLAAYRPGQDALLEQLTKLFSAAGVPVRVHGDYRAMLWEKMVWNAPFNAICALADKSAGAVVEAQPQLVRDAMLEVIRVARADGVTIVDALADMMLQVTRSEYAQTEPSMLQDLRAGRATEVDILQGAVAERAAALGVEAPIMKTLAALIRAAS